MIPAFITLGLTVAAVILATLYLKERKRGQQLVAEKAALEDRFRPIVDVDAERRRVLALIDTERIEAQRQLAAARSELIAEQERVANLLKKDRSEAAVERAQLLESATAERARVIAAADAERSAATAAIAAERESANRDLVQAAEARGRLAGEIAELTSRRTKLEAEVTELDEISHLQSFGFYRKHFDFPTSAGYDAALEESERDQKAAVKAGQAAYCSAPWTVNGSEKEGAKMVKRLSTLMLRAFNGECDAAIARVRYNNMSVMEARIRKSFEAINRLMREQNIEITETFLRLRLKELWLTHEHQELLQAEKEEQRRIREQIREEEAAQRELERAREDAEKEERRYELALEKARREMASTEGAKQERLLEKIALLEASLAAAHEQKERAVAQAQLTRSGHVYVISNVGSFGEQVYKIGMTRRLDPQERIKELGDASVPFAFDVHAVIYTEDAPGLENKLHRAFADRRINLVNERKEFFAVDIEEVVKVVRENHGDVLITKAAAAEEYRKTVALLRERGVERPGWGSYDRRSRAEPAASVA